VTRWEKLSEREKAEIQLIATLTAEATLALEERLARIKRRIQRERKSKKLKSKMTRLPKR
jgi:hypothetical protein